MSNAREILRDADTLRRSARDIERGSELLKPGSASALRIGSYEISDRAVIAAVRSTLDTFAADLVKQADALEARIEVRR